MCFSFRVILNNFSLYVNTNISFLQCSRFTFIYTDITLNIFACYMFHKMNVNKCLWTEDFSSFCHDKQSQLNSFDLTSQPKCLVAEPLIVCTSLQCLYPRGERPVSTHYSDRLRSAFPWGAGTGLGSAQPLLDRFGWQNHLCGFSGWQKETCADQHRSERTTGHRCGSRERVSRYQTDLTPTLPL